VEEVGEERHPGERFLVARVLDGDTFELAGGDKVRLLAIDTPEKGQKFHDEAASMLKRLSLNKSVRLEYSRTRRDRYGRILAFVYADDTLFANRLLIDSGLAYLYLFDDQEQNLPQVQEMLRAQKRAVTNLAGMWGVDKEDEEFYVTTEKSHRFHRPGCRSIEDSDEEHRRVFDTKQEALFEGLSPCRNCKP
jgi:micrococcal nuclease